ncbi:MAG: amidohydrolase [Gammaproteobacteria bacterium]|nr:amidohydrolase [Gammaproteobacteria bacterium]
MRRTTAPLLLAILFGPPTVADAADDGLAGDVAGDATYLEALYVDLHRHPELHDQETRTGARMAEELRTAGFTVNANIGGNGVLGRLDNGAGPVLLVRTIMDALPVAEQTGLAYASRVTATAADGSTVPVAHACGHDAMMTAAIGAARWLAAHRDAWRGTLLVVAQPADESITGARTMLADGLRERMPRPDYVLGYHLLPDYASDEVAWVEGYALAGAETADIVVRGIPGHGSFPADARDPVPLAAQIVTALQTLVTRRVPPLEVASLNVGYIHGGQEVNAIPAEVRLGVTVRFYDESVRTTLVEGIRRIAEYQARAYGMPDDRLPLVDFLPSGIGATFNDPDLTRKARAGFERALGPDHVVAGKRLLGTDETVAFAEAYDPPVPMLFFFYGSSAPAALAAAANGGPALPSLHAPEFKPDLAPTLDTGTRALVGAVTGILPP